MKIDDDDILDRVAQFNQINVIIANDRDQHHQSKKYQSSINYQI